MSTKESETIVPPLLDMITLLKKQGLRVGISDYRLLIECLRNGYGVMSKESLVNLCVSLWATSEDEVKQITLSCNLYFNQVKTSLRKEKTNKTTLPKRTEGKHVKKDDFTESTQKASTWVLDAMNILSTSEILESKEEYQIVDNYYGEFEELKMVLDNSLEKSDVVYLTEIDIEKTVSKVAKELFLLKPEYRKAKSRCEEVILLFDVGTRMTPYYSMFNQVIETIENEDDYFKKVTSVYYNENPSKTQFFDKYLLQPVISGNIISEVDHNSLVIIITDAGSVMKSNSNIIHGLTSYIKQLKEKTSNVYWLNPIHSKWWYNMGVWHLTELVDIIKLNE